MTKIHLPPHGLVRRIASYVVCPHACRCVSINCITSIIIPAKWGMWLGGEFFVGKIICSQTTDQRTILVADLKTTRKKSELFAFNNSKIKGLICSDRYASIRCNIEIKHRHMFMLIFFFSKCFSISTYAFTMTIFF